MAARGYAVLLPDPALSTGYGVDFLQRGWGAWGGRPFTDLMALTDATIERPDIDRSRTAAMGGSFGGYMANWVSTQTDRFRAIVTHASLWHLDAFAGATDEPAFWHREFGDPLQKQERYLANSPHLRAESIRTPMLVIHGDKDYRVPIGEALRLGTTWDASMSPPQVPLLPGREPLDPRPGTRQGLVSDRRCLPRRACPGRALAAARPDLIGRRSPPLTSA